MATFTLPAAAILVMIVTTFPFKRLERKVLIIRTLPKPPVFHTSLWHRMAALPHPVVPPSVSTAMMMTSSISRVECVAKCISHGGGKGREPCVGVLYRKADGGCFLFARFDSSTLGNSSASEKGGLLGMELIVNEANLCDAKEAEQRTKNGKVDVINQTSVTSLQASVKCADDFMPTTDDVPLLSCRDGQWSQLQGTCLQRIWRKGTVQVDVNYIVPRVPVPGWSTCATAVFDGTERWVFNLRANADDLFNFDTRYDQKDRSNITLLNHRLGGINGYSGDDIPTVSEQGYPFLPYNIFNFTVRGDSNSEVQVLVGGKFYTNYTLPLPLSSVTFVNFRYQVQVLFLDLWCSP